MGNVIGQETLSFSKQQVADSTKELVQGVRRLLFAHKATGGETGFDLASLSIPSELSANGFTNPSPSELLGANLNVYRRNLRLYSSRGAGRLFEFDAYVLAGSKINFLPNFGTALAGEIFIGEVDYVPISHPVVSDARFVSRTYNLAKDQTTLNLGEIFQVNESPTEQIGALRVRRNGMSQLRNVGNATASVSADGNYQELDSGNGFGSSIKFNIAPSNAAGDVIEVDFGLHVAQADQNLFGSIELLTGALLKIAQDAAAGFHGDSNYSRYLTASPTELERRKFGDLLLALEKQIYGPGSILQVAYAERQDQPTLVNTNGFNITAAPTISQGNSIWTPTFQPKKANSLILIETMIYGREISNGSDKFTGAIWSGSTLVAAGAAAESFRKDNSANDSGILRIVSQVPNTGAAITLDIRAGFNGAGQDWQLNTAWHFGGSTTSLGGNIKSFYKITEIAQ